MSGRLIGRHSRGPAAGAALYWHEGKVQDSEGSSAASELQTDSRRPRPWEGSPIRYHHHFRRTRGRIDRTIAQ
jgi:hypothetical protein